MPPKGIAADPSAFLGFQCPPESAAALILPIPFEETTTYRTGTRDGPGAILEASRQVELYDEELSSEPYLHGIHTLDVFTPVSSDPEESVAQIEKEALRHLKKKRILASLGGEHTVTMGLVRAHKKIFPRLSVLQVDAHADLRPSYQGSPYNHACVMYQVSKICPTVQVGIRSMSAEEAGIARQRRTNVTFARDIMEQYIWWRSRSLRSLQPKGFTPWMHDAAYSYTGLASLTDHVYLTIDLDGLDPSIMPSVGTPEPGGIGWYEMLEFMKFVTESAEIVGLDIVELCPQASNPAPDFLAARLTYKILGYIFSSWQKHKMSRKSSRP